LEWSVYDIIRTWDTSQGITGLRDFCENEGKSLLREEGLIDRAKQNKLDDPDPENDKNANDRR
jgi:hypothetical protein